MHTQIRAALNGLAKAGMGFAACHFFMLENFSLWSVLLVIFCIVLDNQTARLPEDKTRREMDLEFEIERLKHAASCDALTLETTKAALESSIAGNNALLQQFKAWGVQGELQADILKNTPRS